MEKVKIREEIMRILTLDIDNQPRRKRNTYLLSYMLFLFGQYAIALYMVFFLSKKWSYFGILGVIYCSILLALLLIVHFLYRDDMKNRSD
jgi:membrane protein YdbS with pleckstrin-like domain